MVGIEAISNKLTVGWFTITKVNSFLSAAAGRMRHSVGHITHIYVYIIHEKAANQY